MDPIAFLADENMPAQVVEFLRARGRVVYPVGESFAKASPDPLLVAAAEVNGLVVLTFDRDFRSLIRQLPPGTRGQADRTAGRIRFSCNETRVLSRLAHLIDVIEFQYAFARKQGKRLIMQISETSYTFSG